MIKPLHDRILVKVFRNNEFSDGGIYQGSPMTTFVRDISKAEQVTVGEVISVGEGKYNKKGQRRAPEPPIGSIVCFSDTCGRDVGDDDYLMIRESDVYGYLPEFTSVEHIYHETGSIAAN